MALFITLLLWCIGIVVTIYVAVALIIFLILGAFSDDPEDRKAAVPVALLWPALVYYLTKSWGSKDMHYQPHG